MSEELVRTHLVQHGYQDSVQLRASNARSYTFQYLHLTLGIAVEFYNPPAMLTAPAEREYDQIRFLVTYHIKLIHRTFADLRFARAFAIGDFTPRAREYARRHGGMELLSVKEALQDLTIFTRQYPPLEYRSKALTAPVRRA